MSNGNNQNRLDLLDTTKRVPNGLTRSRLRSHGAIGVPIISPDNRPGPSMHTSRIYERQTVLKTYKPTNMNRAHSQSRVFEKAPLEIPRRRGVMVPSKPDVITIDDEKPRRRITESMNSKEPSKRNDDSNSNKRRIYQKQQQQQQQQKSTTENSSRRNKSRIVQDDEDEAVEDSKAFYKKLHQRLGYKQPPSYVDATTSTDDEDEDRTKGKGKCNASGVQKDIFNIDSVEETTARRKRTRGDYDVSQRQYGKQRDGSGDNVVPRVHSTAAKAGGSSSRGIRVDEGEEQNDDDEEDVWEKQVSENQEDGEISTKRRRLRSSNDNKDDFHDLGTSNEAVPEAIPQMEYLPKRQRTATTRRVGYVFYSNPDDIPVDPEKSGSSTSNNTKSSTDRFRSDTLPTRRPSATTAALDNLTKRVTRSATRAGRGASQAFQSISNNVRGFLGQPQYITIDDDDDSDVEMQQRKSPPRSESNGQQVLFHYPSSAPGSVTVVREDANRLMDGQMLNDSIIDFYVKWLLTNAEIPSGDQSIAERVHVFNTFFFARLKQSTKGDPYESVKKWTAKINLFEKDIVFIPINENSHWYLLVVCNLKKCISDGTETETECIDLSKDGGKDDSKQDGNDRAIIYSLDSMGIGRQRSASRISKYLQSAAQDRLGIDAKQFRKPKYVKAIVPTQSNSYDCGIFVLHFIETFLQQPQEVMAVLTEKVPDDKVWMQAKISEKREYISDLITGLCQSNDDPMQEDQEQGQNTVDDDAFDTDNINVGEDHTGVAGTAKGTTITSSADDPPSSSDNNSRASSPR